MVEEMETLKEENKGPFQGHFHCLEKIIPFNNKLPYLCVLCLYVSVLSTGTCLVSVKFWVNFVILALLLVTSILVIVFSLIKTIYSIIISMQIYEHHQHISSLGNALYKILGLLLIYVCLYFICPSLES